MLFAIFSLLVCFIWVLVKSILCTTVCKSLSKFLNIELLHICINVSSKPDVSYYLRCLHFCIPNLDTNFLLI